MLARLKKPESVRGLLIWWGLMTSINLVPALMENGGYVGPTRVASIGGMAALGAVVLYALTDFDSYRQGSKRRRWWRT